MSLIFDNITFEGKLILSENTAGGGGAGGGAVTAQYLALGGMGGMNNNTRQGQGLYHAAGGTGGVSTGTLTLSAGKTYNINIGQGGAMNDYYSSYSYFSYGCWCNYTYENWGAGGAGGSSYITTTSTYNAGTSTGSIEYNATGITGYIYGPSYSYRTQFNPYYGATWFDRDSVQSFGIEAWVFPKEDRSMVFFSLYNQTGYQLWSFGMGDAFGNNATVHGTKKPYFGAWDGTSLSSQLNSSCVWGADDLPMSQWTHLAGMYDSTSKKIKLYVNGKLAGQTADGKSALESYTSYYQTNSGAIVEIGGNGTIGGNPGLNALINDVRYTVGEIAYTSEFTPPTSRLTATQHTVLLGFQSSNTGRLLADSSFVIQESYSSIASNLDPSTNVAVYAGGGGGGAGVTAYGGGKSGSPQSTTGTSPWAYGGGVANVTSSITGTPVVYGGGTASGNISPSLAGYSVSNGYQPFNDPQWEYTHQTLGNDGKYYADAGLVILSIPTANYSGTTTGSPTVTTTGTNTVLVYTQNGTYTA